MNELIVGSRGSNLALRQSKSVIDALMRRYPGISCRLEIIRTEGDRFQNMPLSKIGNVGLFVSEIESALLCGRIDLAVHSAKDLPSEMNDALCIAAYSEREDPSDALISCCGELNKLPSGAKVGTSSVRRRAQLLAARPDLNMVDLRGNLDTRLRKIEDGECDAGVVAVAGLRRMELESHITQVLPFDICLPAAGQGAIAVQCRRGDALCDILSVLDCSITRTCVSAERALLRRLGAGCQTPVGALGTISGGMLRLKAIIAKVDGSFIIRKSTNGNPTDCEEIGSRLAESFLNSPAVEFLNNAGQCGGPRTTGAA